jgi:DNA replication protein DnaC
MTPENLPDQPRVCDIHGTVMEYMLKKYWCQDCMDEARKQEREQFDRERAMQQIRQRLTRTHVPPRYHGTTLANFVVETPAQQLVLDSVRNYIWNFPNNYSSGRCLIFMGGVGTGKTLLASAALQTLANIEFRKSKRRDGDDSGYFFLPEYVTVPTLIRKIRDTWRADAEDSTSNVINHYAGVHL